VNNMEKNINLSVILPIKSALAKDFDTYFAKAIDSLKNQQIEFEELVIVPTQEETLLEVIKNYDFGNLNVRTLPFEGEPNFCSQVNFGIKNANGKWISIFEFDDEYSNIWVKNFKEYANFYPNYDAFLPIVVDTDDKGVFVGFTNEASFAANFTNEMGILTNETLLAYQNFQISGMVIKRSSFIDFGLIKPSFKLTFGYEFLLRMTHNGIKFMSIPKIGYKHLNLREGSIFWNYKNGESILTPDEVGFWIDSAKKEYFFINDRAIKYEPQEV